jgi:transketolase
VGIAEQHMVSLAGGLSLMGKVPFCSTFGAFMSSRAKDQARVNDINQTNVKMVATHCGLSVGEDGPTHQAIDDISSFLGFFHTEIIEPIDPNQTDRIIRYIAKTYGNFYVRMGRAKTPVIKKADGTPFYDENYEFKPGQADIIETGDKVTIVACGPMLAYAQKAIQELNLNGQIELIAVSSFRTLDTKTLATSLQKTGKLITIQDHNVNTGIGMLIDRLLAESGILAKRLHLGVKNYQLSGTADELYEKAGLGVNAIKEAISKFN